MKKRLITVSAILFVIIVGTAVTMMQIKEKNEKGTIQDAGFVIPVEESGAMLIGNMDEDSYHDLSSEGELESDIEVRKEEIFMVQNRFKTNSTEITIVNQGEIPLTVYLYNIMRPESYIQVMDLEPLESGGFLNLTSAYLYSIGVTSAEDTKLKITISD